jgi:adenine-specific DNA-methyltransferase
MQVMNESYLSELELLLSKNDDYTVEDKVNKNKIAELAHKYDPELIDTLAGNKAMRKMFFVETKKDVLVFNKDKFIQFISNKEFLPDSFTTYKNKIGLGTGTELLSEKKEVVLNWAYKDSVLEGGQDKEDAKRDEVFHNEVLAPDQIDRLLDEKVLTGFKRYGKDGEHEVKEVADGDNLIIRGNNLLALHSLKKRYAGKVKLIYIDPPYNTGSDSFGYNDSFNHSTWLTFMRNRLETAKDFLRPDGVMYISLDDSESHYGKVLADEIFGRSNFLANICYQRSGAAGLGQGGKFVVNTAEAILVYAKDKTVFQAYDLEGGTPLELKHMKRYNGVLKDAGNRELIDEFPAKSNGETIRIYKHTGYKLDTISLANYEGRKDEIKQEYVDNFDKIFRLNIPQIENQFQHDLIKRMSDGELYSVDYVASRGRHKNAQVTNYYYKEQLLAWLKSSAKIDGNNIQKTNKLTDFWTHGEIPKADLANEGKVTLSRGKKPEQLLRRIIDMSTLAGDIVMDYHLGSGTTAAVAHKMGRQYIGIEQLDYGKNDVTQRLKNVITGDQSGVSKYAGWQGGGGFVYARLMDLGNKFIEKVKNASTDKELVALLEQAKKSSFLSYKVDPEKINPGDKDFASLSIAHKKQLLLEIVDHNHLYVNYTEIDDADYGVSAEDKKLNKQFYGN